MFVFLQDWHYILPDGVTVAQKILALFVEVRILVGQPGGNLIGAFVSGNCIGREGE